MNDTIDQDLRALLQAPLHADSTTYEAAEARSLRETASAVRVHRRRSAPRRVRLSVAIACAASIAVSGVAVAAGLDVIDLPFTNGLAKDVPALSDPQAEQLTDEDYARISKGVNVLTTGFANGPATAAGGMQIDRGVVLLDDPANGRLIAVSSEAGDVCFNYFHRGGDKGVSCAKELSPTGVVYSQLISGDEQQLYGLAASDISSITVHGSDGRDYPATLERNAFAWASEPGVAPSEVTIVRAGVSRSYTMAHLTGL